MVLTPRLAPKAAQLAYVSFAGGRPAVRVVDLDSGQERPLVASDAISFAPRFSPDGSRIAFSMMLGANSDIYVVGANGGPAVAPHVEAGRLRGLAVVGAERWDAFPDLPALAELGFGEGWPGSGWFGLIAPAGTPAPVVARLNQAFNEGLAEPEVAAALRRFGLRVEPLSPEAVGQRIADDHAAVGRALHRLRIA